MASYPQPQETVREAVGVFKNADKFQEAVDELLTNGFEQRHLSILAKAETIEEKLSYIYRRTEDIADDPDTKRTIFVPSENIGNAEGVFVGVPLYIAAATTAALVVASGGTLLAAFAAAGVAGAAGATIGGVYANIVGKNHADTIQEQINQGGLLLWVNTPTPECEEKATAILKKYGAEHVYVHDVPLHNSEDLKQVAQS